MKTKVLNAAQMKLLWVIPLVLTTAHFLYWPLVRGTSLAFPAFVAAVPFLFGMIMVGTTTRRWHLWSWTIPMAHVSFLWSAYGMLGPLVLTDTISLPFSVLGAVKMSALTGFLGAVTGTVIDTVSMDEGLLTVHARPAGWGTVKIVTSYSFAFFGSFGVFFGLLTKVGHYYLVELGETSRVWLLTVGGSLALSAVFLAYFGRPGSSQGTAEESASKQPESIGT